jgi:hypothetical protein
LVSFPPSPPPPSAVSPDTLDEEQTMIARRPA